ncbi:uncharacterized protein LOC108163311 [Drosophila miranda]|uniref:uncharacterized protein LOC108163311 n=1 Tax=Drosophila miranda TaxID=7229 RepID=UPI0007E88A32|nr:uncharacterized protein LOC108163311 [Drosophila miranda]
MNFLSRCAKSVGAMCSRGPRGLRFLFHDCGDDHSSGIMAEITKKIKEQVGVEMGYHTIPKFRAGLLKTAAPRSGEDWSWRGDAFSGSPLKETDSKPRQEHESFIGCARELIMSGKKIAELCEHNSEVSKKYGKHNATTFTSEPSGPTNQQQ